MLAAMMPPGPEPQPFALDAALPAELAGRQQGWFSRYRRFPVYSRPWVQGRLRVMGPVMVLVFLGLSLPIVLGTRGGDAPSPLGGLLQLLASLLLPVWLGPRLALAVRRRSWPPPREWAALVGAMSLVVLAMVVFHEWGAEPVKQWVAERQGAVDASGKRRRVVMSFGLNVWNPDAPPDVAASERERDRSLTTRATNAISVGLITFWLAGGSGLWAWRRELAGLAALARERELAQAQARRREAELRLSVLAAQVEPHFLFNTLAGVRSAISTDPARASDMIDRLVDYLRASIPRLRSDGQVQATVGAQLDTVRAYLGLMAARMPRLQWRVQADQSLLAARCPPLMLISLAENAVKHGVERKLGPAHIDVTAGRDADGLLVLRVLDDGPGFEPAASGSGLGLTNIRERLAQLYPGQATLTLQARPEGGVVATLRLPLEMAPDD
jgi:signal transduction histidine kinase